MMSPNESVSQTIAGTNASPINSLIVKLSSSHPIRLDPATKRKVKSGANIAYIQSLIALTRSMVARARVRSQNTANMIVLTIDVWTSCIAAVATSSQFSNVVISLNLNIEYPYTMSGPYIPPDFSRNFFGEIHQAPPDLLQSACAVSVPVHILLTTIAIGIDGLVNHAESFAPIVSYGIVITEAVTTLDIEMVHWTNHQVNGTMRIPRASFGSITL